MLRVVDITEISAMVAAAGVLVGVVWYILDMRNQTRLRQTDLVMRLYAVFATEEFQKGNVHIDDRPGNQRLQYLQEKVRGQHGSNWLVLP